ncbi:MAG TPA: hypothetical protein G4O16_10300 [Dehalococcoidia bacterium]|nr:hypothetical protein [Dehalococcoidia bacterium]
MTAGTMAWCSGPCIGTDGWDITFSRISPGLVLVVDSITPRSTSRACRL